MVWIITLAAIAYLVVLLVRSLRRRGWEPRQIWLTVGIPLIVILVALGLIWAPTGHSSTGGSSHVQRLQPLRGP